MKINRIENINEFFHPQIEKKEGNSFGDLLKDFIANVNKDLLQAKKAEEKIASGEVDNIQELLYQVSKSEISLRLITEIRNKALESYQEIMRMQV